MELTDTNIIGKEQDKIKEQEQILAVYDQSFPAPRVKDNKPFEIYEDVNLEELTVGEDAVAQRQQARTSRREAKEARKLKRQEEREARRSRRSSRKGTKGLLRAERIDARAQIKDSEDPEATPYLYQNEKYKDFKQREILNANDFDVFGAVDNSFVRHGYEWVRQTLEEGYEPSNSIKGRLAAMEVINGEIAALGPVKLTEYDKIREAKDLWNKKYELRLKNDLDQQLLDQPDMEFNEVIDIMMDNKLQVGKAILQEIFNKPELLLVPEFAAIRGAQAFVSGTKAITASTKAAQVSKYVGLTAGAGAGGAALGIADRAATQSTTSGEVDLAKAAEDSLMDAALGVVIVGGVRTLTRGVNKVKAKNAEKAKLLEALGDDVSTKNIINGDYFRDAAGKQADDGIEIMVDDNGNLYEFEVREVLDLKARKAESLAMRKKYKEDQEAKEALDAEIASIDAELEVHKGSLPKGMLETKYNLENQRSAIPANKEVADKLFNKEQRGNVTTHNFLQVEDAEGTSHTLRRLTPDMFEDQIKVEGIPGSILSGKFDYESKSPSAWMTKLQGAIISATAPLNKVAASSPTAKLLLDAFNPNSKNGRSPIHTVQENTEDQQGKFLMRSNDIYNSGVDEKAVMLHMRDVTLSEDPKVLKASADIRKLLDDVATYAKDKGMEVDTSPNFLPRYYARSSLETPESRLELANRVHQYQPKLEDGSALGSAMRIFKNSQKETDEVAAVHIKEKKQYPIGHRKWKETPDKELHPFLEDAFFAGIDRYIGNAVKRTEIDVVMGPGGAKIETWKNQINQELKEGKGPNEEFRELTDAEHKAIGDIYLLAIGAYGGTPMGKPLTDAALAVTNVLSLPLVTATSAMEPLTLLHKLREESGIKSVIDTYSGVPGLGKMKKLWGDMSYADRKREADEMFITASQAMSDRMDALVGDGIEGLPAKINRGAMKTFMLHQFTELTRRKAYEAAKRDTVKIIKNLAKDPNGSKTSTRKRWLAEMNINPDQAVKWLEEGALPEGPMYNRIQRGSARFAKQMIVSPDKFNKGKLYSSNSSFLRLATQYKSFASTFVNSVAGSSYDELVKLWNSGNKSGFFRKAASTIGVMGGISYWASYNRDIMAGEAIGDDSMLGAVAKTGASFATLTIPGASALTTFYSGFSAEGASGPAIGKTLKVTDHVVRQAREGKAPNAERVAKLLSPTLTKGVKAIAEAVD